MTAAISLPHQIWRTLPQGIRRAAFNRASAALAPRPDRVPPPPRPGLAVGGEFGRASGLGEGARLMAVALKQLDVPCFPLDVGDLTSPGVGSRGAVPACPGAVPLVLHVNAPSLPAALLRLPRVTVKGRRVIGFWAWELPVASPGWAHGGAFVHEVWAPSRFTADALAPLVPDKPIRVVPHAVAVDPPRPAPLARADFGLPDDALVVLTSFSLASSFARKNPLAAIGAFRQAFGADTAALLVLKISHTEAWPRDLATIRAAVADAPNIRIETRTLPAADSHALTASSDIVLSLHRSEGFGLVPAEAMLLGKPVVATNWSATAEFLTPDNAAPVAFRLFPARDPRGVFEAPGAVWAEADQNDAAAALRALAADPGRRRALGQAALRDAGQRFTAAPLLAALQAIGSPLTRALPA